MPAEHERSFLLVSPSRFQSVALLTSMKVHGSRGFTIIELLVVIAIIGVIAALTVPGLLRARQSANESSAISSLRAINSAQSAYAASCGYGFYAPNLTTLGIPPSAGATPFLSPDLTTADVVTKSGYVVTMGSSGGATASSPASCNGIAAGAGVSGYNATATPQSGSGSRAFGTNGMGTVYEASQTTAIAMTDTTAPAGARPIQ